MNLGEDAADKSGGSELEVEEGFVVCYGGDVVIWLELVEHVSLEFRGKRHIFMGNSSMYSMTWMMIARFISSNIDCRYKNNSKNPSSLC